MPPRSRKNLLLCVDAFDTLFTPNTPIPIAYAQAASRYGIYIPSTNSLASSFKSSFKHTSQKYPNYGKNTKGLTPEKWWEIIITSTFSPFLEKGQTVPDSLMRELLEHYSSSKGYTLFDDVKPFFNMLSEAKKQHSASNTWPWNRTIVGVITNSDNRIPSILSSFDLEVGFRRCNHSTQRPTSETEARTLDDEDINFIILSYDASVEKPHPVIFYTAQTILSDILSAIDDDHEGVHLGEDDFEKLHVGDDLEKDYLGAKAAGWGALLLRRDQGTIQGIQRAEVEGKDGEKKRVDAIGSLMDIAGWRPA